MKFRTLATGAAALWLTSGVAFADDEHTGQNLVGKVAFANSCSPAVQAEFLRGVAMLHSFW